MEIWLLGIELQKKVTQYRDMMAFEPFFCSSASAFEVPAGAENLEQLLEEIGSMAAIVKSC